MDFYTDQYSLASIPHYWPYPFPTPPPPLPPFPPFPPWPGIHILYTEARLPAGVDPIGPLPAPTLRYQDSTRTLEFSGSEITVESTVLGRLLTVTLLRSVDQGATLCTLLLPEVAEPAPSALTPLTTVGLTSVTAGPISIPRPPQSIQYTTTNLSGTLSTSQTSQPGK